MKIHEVTQEDGSFLGIHLTAIDGSLVLKRGSETMFLPDGALAAVMKRYGAPFDPTIKVREVDSLPLPDGGTLVHVRHLDFYDVIARDYLVLGDSCAMATTVAGALEHLARAAVR
jgi:hypothetical protein